MRFSQLPRTRVSLPHAKCRARTNHSSHFGTVPPAPLAGLVSFASAAFADALCLADSAGCSRSFRRSQTAETDTDSGAPKADNGGRDAPHIGQDQNYGRDAPHVAQTTDIAVRPTSFRGAALAKQVGLTDQTTLV